MLFAPVLNEVAARMATEPVSVCEDPERGAYQLKEAISLVRPDWVLTHHAPELEASAVRGLVADGTASTDLGDLVDTQLARTAPVSRVVALVEILAGLYPNGTVAVSVTGPAGLCSTLTENRTEGQGLDADVLADCGDVLAELVSAYIAAGAHRVLVWEPEIGEPDQPDVADAHVPLVRRLEMLGVPGVLCGGAGANVSGYSAHALARDGRGAALIAPECFRSAPGAVSFAQLWREWAAQTAPHSEAELPLLVSEGPLPAESDMSLLRAAGERKR
ncbi:hypothetical protein [Nocardiopsis oceani]